MIWHQATSLCWRVMKISGFGFSDCHAISPLSTLTLFCFRDLLLLSMGVLLMLVALCESCLCLRPLRVWLCVARQRYTTLYHIVLYQCDTLRLHCRSAVLHYTTLRYAVLHCTVLLHYIVLHCTVLLHCTGLVEPQLALWHPAPAFPHRLRS
jgi:hypothetical protein